MDHRKGLILIFLAILLVSLVLRLYKLDSVPAGFHQDEVANAYVGRFILQNGVDLYGNHFPLLYFNKHGDYPPVIPMYISALGTLFFGMTVFGARIVDAIIGSLVVIPVFFIALLTFKKKKIALIASFFAAITPWHIAFSRVSTEGTIAVTIFLSGIALFLYAYERKQK